MNEKLEKVCEDILEDIKNGNIDRDNLENKKLEYCGKYGASEVPKNNEILNYSDIENEKVRKVLQVSPVRSSSGVSPITIMTHPLNLCPHGRCYFCPAGKDSMFENTQISYPGGPCVMRAKQENYDPYGQVKRRLSQLHYNGHNVDKIELIVKSGTITSRSHDYQEWFVRRALKAMNDYNTSERPETIEKETFSEESPEFNYIEDVIKNNEQSEVRCIGITFETKPDWCNIEQIDRMLDLGVTKAEIGVQTTYDHINEKVHRGHGKKESVRANKNLRNSGMKVGFHMMPGLPGMDKDMILEDFERIFEQEEWKPDYLKIYPTLVVPGTKVYDMWKKDEFEPLSTEEASSLIAEIKENIPPYVRLQRVQRDIPADKIAAGVKKSNLRQLARKEMDGNCDCIRCREVGLNETDIDISNLNMNVNTYRACDGIEKFISIEDNSSEQLVGFARLRLPEETHRKELQNSSIVRELHVYGNQVSLENEEDEEYQHQGYGKQLMNKAEQITEEHSKEKISVISGIGVREYYRSKLGYSQDGPYVSKKL